MAKNNKNQKNKKLNITFIILFIATFVITILFIKLLFKYFSVPVDVSIGNNSELQEVEEEDFNLRQKEVDDRLKWIQYEDNADEMPVSNEISELIEKDSKKEESAKTTEINDNQKDFSNVPIPILAPIKLQEPENVISLKQITKDDIADNTQESFKPTANALDKEEPIMTTIKMTRVYTGFYSSLDAASEDLSKISGSISGISPYIKNMNGKYIVQIASFADREKALNLRKELESKGFPVKLLSD